jgi:RNA polymerase primary sigma factor
MTHNFSSDAERDKVIEENMHLVPKVAHKYRDIMSMDELVAAGNLGLIKGVDKFDPSRGYKVSTYAVNCIRAEILAALYENRNVHIPWNKIGKALKSRKDNDKNHENKKKIADYPLMEISLDRKPQNIYVDAYDEENDNDMRNAIEEGHSLSGDTVTQIEAKELREYIDFAIEEANLSGVEKTCVVYKFGLNGEEPKTLQQIATMLSYTRMGVQKAQQRAMEKLSKCKVFRGMRK